MNIRRIFAYMDDIHLEGILEKLNAHGDFIAERVTYAPKDKPKVVFRKGKKTIAQVLLELKKVILPKDIPNILNQDGEILNDELPTILAAEYITTDARKRLRAQGIGYADAAGNVFLNHDPVYIFIETGTNGRARVNKEGDRVFTKTGLKLVYHFLVHPEDVNKTYRVIGNLAGIAIDTVGKVIKQLLKEGYLLKQDKRNYAWRNREELFQKWVEGYNRTLRPKLDKLIVAPKNEMDWNDLPRIEDTYWGGTAAANEVVPELIVKNGIIYTHKDHYALLRERNWYPKDGGTITIYKAFWNSKHADLGNQLHPIIIYADLLHGNDPRQLEVAQKLYELKIEPKL